MDHSHPTEQVHQDSHISQSHGKNGVASRDIFDAIHVPLCLCDPLTGGILSTNDSFTRQFGYGSGGPGTLTLGSLGTEQSRPVLSTRLAHTLEGSAQTFSWTVLGKNGQEHPVEMSLTLVDESGARRVLAQFRPLRATARSEAEREFSDAVINSVPGAFYLIDLEGHLIRWNSITERVSGYTAAEIRAMSPDQFFAPEDRERLRHALRHAFKTGSATVECTLVTRTGRRIPFLTSGRRIELHGTSYLIGLGIDISERRQIEDALRQSEERYRSLIEDIHDILFATDERGVVTYISPSAEATTGFRPVEIVGRHFAEFIAPEDLPLIQSRFRDLEAGLEEPSEYRVRSKSGKDHWVQSSSRPRYRDGKFVGITGIMTDVHARKVAEHRFRESQERLDLVVSGADLGTWDWDIPTGRVTHNARWAEMLGFSPDELEQRFTTWQMLVHPEDKDTVLQRLQDHLEGRTPLYEAELRLQAKDGSWRWMLDRGKVVRRNPAGAPLRMSGTQLDITERREAENRLRGSLREKELLLREIHHRVKNNLQVISSLFSLQAQTISDPKVLAALKESHNRVRSMGLVHHVMYQTTDFAAVDLVDYVRTLARSLYRSYSVDPEAVLLSVDIANVRLGIDAAIPCGLIINELVSNALRHAYPDGRRGTLSVTLAHCDDGTNTLTVRDDGIGLPADIVLPPAGTLGLALVDTLTRQLEGTLAIERSGGTAVSVRFAGHSRA